MSNLHTIDLGVPESLHILNDNFISHANINELEEGLVVQASMEDNFEANVDKGHESKAEKDYLNQLEAFFIREPQEELRSPRNHFYVPLIETVEEE
jgi:hypothetical protein